LHEQAQREARLADERLTRVRRDYADGRLGAADWLEFREELGAERDAARAELDRLAEQEREVESWGELRDAEAETLQRISDIRAAIAGEVKDADGLDAVRAALSRLFERFIIRRQTRRVHVELIVAPPARHRTHRARPGGRGLQRESARDSAPRAARSRLRKTTRGFADAIGEFTMRSGRSLSRDAVPLARGLQRRPTPGRRLSLRPAVMTGAGRSGHGGLGAGLIIRLVH
jgi:hypothetical protein